MAHVSRNALVPYSSEQMFKLVDDVSSYPEFLPWCADARELSRDVDLVEASVTISKSTVQKTFTTQNLLQPYKMIEMKLVDGPFKHLHGFWQFDALKENACKVSLDLEYEFSSKLLGMAVGPVFNQIANTLVDSFVKQARVKYG